jgi:hypothetical protein
MVERDEVDQTIRVIGRGQTLTRHSEARRRPHAIPLQWAALLMTRPDAPKGGSVRRAALGTFDNFARIAVFGIH